MNEGCLLRREPCIGIGDVFRPSEPPRGVCASIVEMTFSGIAVTIS